MDDYKRPHMDRLAWEQWQYCLIEAVAWVEHREWANAATCAVEAVRAAAQMCPLVRAVGGKR